MNKPYFQLFASCIPVKGAVNHILCDLQRGVIQRIPESLFVILSELKSQTISEIKALFTEEQGSRIEEYFRFLETEEWGFWSEDPALFPDLDLSWDSPATITNAVVDVDESSDHPWTALFAQLNELGCQALQLRTYTPLSKEALIAILEQVGPSRLKSIELVIKYHEDYQPTNLEALCLAFPRLSSISIHGAPEARKWSTPYHVSVQFTTQVIDSAAHCGFIHQDFFSADLMTFTESQKHNSCLNRKISIDSSGAIKNCPSMTSSYGHVATTPLREVASQAAFQELWNIAKDQVEICRDCEFRYVCTDCRAFTSGGSRYGKPSKCNYDPYTGVWA